MKILGLIMLIGGVCLGIYALRMDTTVAVNYSEYSYGLPDRVNNLGLMSDRQNYLIVAGILSVLGIIIYFFSNVQSQRQSQEQVHSISSEYKQCPQCAEMIRSEAKICRFCNYDFSAIKDESINEEAVNYVIDSDIENTLMALKNLIMQGKKSRDKTINYLKDCCSTKDKSIQLIKAYHSRFNSNMIDDLKKISSNYNAIEANVSVFIEFGIVNAKYPHEILPSINI